MKFFYPTADVTVQNFFVVLLYLLIFSLFIGRFQLNVHDVGDYGKLAHRSKRSRMIYLPRRWFWHYYLNAVILFVLASWTVCRVYFMNDASSETFRRILRSVSPANQRATVSPQAITIAIFLMSCHVIRRLTECFFIHVFSDSKMTLVPYIGGFIFYFGTCFSILVEAPGFAPNEHGSYIPSFKDGSWFTFYHVLGVVIFWYGFFLAFQSHVILARIRKNDRGKVTSQQYSIPYGGLFEMVTCPHYLGEILMYLGVHLIFAGKNDTWGVIFWFVVANQVQSALKNHQWYKTTYSNYPNHRRAIIPYLL